MECKVCGEFFSKYEFFPHLNKAHNVMGMHFEDNCECPTGSPKMLIGVIGAIHASYCQFCKTDLKYVVDIHIIGKDGDCT